MHLVWVQLEAYGALNQEKNSILQQALTQLDFNTINLTQTVCAAPSTVMTTMGLLTGVTPVLLAKDHIPKRQQVPDDWQAVGFTTITDFLEKQDYDVVGINAVFDSPRCLPMFKDTHAGVTPDMKQKEGYNFWEAWCIPQRLRNIIPGFKKEKKAFFFHLIDADILPEIIQELQDIGLNKSNTVMVLVGDHGWPIRFKEKEPALFHDLHQEENNIRVACHLAYPGCKSGIYPHFSSALDLAPTVLEILGFSPENALPKSHGNSLKKHLENNSPASERIIRIDNRYIAQRKNKIITLVNSKLRYTFRYETNWEQQPYYQYRFKPVNDKEELYLREDIEESENLIFNDLYKSEIETFRAYLKQSETELLNHFYPDDLFEHYLLSGYFSDNKEGPKRIHSSPRIQKILLKQLNEKLIQDKIENVALFGAGNHTRSILKHGIINTKTSVILDDNPLFDEIDGIPVISSQENNINFEALIISSDYFELQLKQRAEEWLPEDKLLLTIYEDFGSKLHKLLLENYNFSFSDFLTKVIDVCLPENILSLNEPYLKNCCTEGTVYFPDEDHNFSFKPISSELPEAKFDLVVYNSENVLELTEWLSRIDELLDSCGIFLAQVETDMDIKNHQLENIAAKDLELEIIKTGSSTVVLGYLWRFNS